MSNPLTTQAHSQAVKRLVLSANTILPRPAPRSPHSAWRSEPGRETVEQNIGGQTLRGYRYTGTDPGAPLLLFFNGNGMPTQRADMLYRQLASLGPSVVVFDYRGFGFSDGSPDVMGFRTDGLDLYDRLLASAPGRRVVVFGVSLGTAMAAYIASERPVAGLILGMPIASAAQELPVFGRLLGYPSSQLIEAVPSAEAKAIFDEVDLVARSRAPLLIVHGADDEVVPIAQGRQVLAASASPQKRMVEVSGAGHSAAVASVEAALAIAQFLNALH